MSTIHRAAVGLALVAGLAGCSHVTSSTKAANGVTTAQESAVQKGLDIKVGKSAQVKVDVPATALIMNSLRNLVAAMPPGTPSVAVPSRDRQGIGTIQKTFVDLVGGKQGKAIAARHVPTVAALRRAFIKGHNPYTGMLLLGFEKKEHITGRLHAAEFILDTARPVYGWPVNILAGQKVQGEKWAEYQAVQANFANLIVTNLAAKLPKGALADPQVAQETIAWDFLHMHPQDIQAAARQAVKSVESGLAAGMTINTAESQNVQFQIGDSSYTGETQGGWSVSENGVKWFGDGHLSGRNVTIGLESSINKDVSQQRNIVQKLANDINNGSESGATAEASE